MAVVRGHHDDPKGAIQALDGAERGGFDEPRLWIMRAECRILAGDHVGARADAEAVLRRKDVSNGDMRDAVLTRSRALLSSRKIFVGSGEPGERVARAWCSLADGEAHDEVVTLAKWGWAVGQGTKDVCLARARARAAMGEWQGALEAYEAAESADGGRSSPIARGCSTCLRHLCRWEEAIAALSKVRRVADRDRLDRACCKAYLGRWEEALLDFLRVPHDVGDIIEDADEAANVYRLRGLCHMRLRHWAEALLDLERVGVQGPRAALAWERARCLVELCRRDDALLAIDEAEAAGGVPAQDIALARWRARVSIGDLRRAALECMKGHKWESAVEALDEAAGRGGAGYGLYANRGLCHARMGLWREAFGDYEEAEAAAPPGCPFGDVIKHNRACCMARLGLFLGASGVLSCKECCSLVCPMESDSASSETQEPKKM